MSEGRPARTVPGAIAHSIQTIRWGRIDATVGTHSARNTRLRPYIESRTKVSTVLAALFPATELQYGS